MNILTDKNIFFKKILLKADSSQSKLSEYAKQYDAFSAVNKILYEFSHAYSLKFYCNSSDFFIFCLITDFSKVKAALF